MKKYLFILLAVIAMFIFNSQNVFASTTHNITINFEELGDAVVDEDVEVRIRAESKNEVPYNIFINYKLFTITRLLNYFIKTNGFITNITCCY